MPLNSFTCPECGSRRLTVSCGNPPCYYCVLCAYIVRDETGKPVSTEEGLRAWVFGPEGRRADAEHALQSGMVRPAVPCTSGPARQSAARA